MATCKECFHYVPCFSGGKSIWDNIEQTKDGHCKDFVPTADVVPVVRCKDCEHGQYMPSCSMYLCRCTGGKLRYADNYCNYGERRMSDEKI